MKMFGINNDGKFSLTTNSRRCPCFFSMQVGKDSVEMMWEGDYKQNKEGNKLNRISTEIFDFFQQ